MVDDIHGLRRILKASKVISVVGLSGDWFRPSYFAAKYMLEHGYAVIPVNPGQDAILGQKSYKSLRDIPVKVDIVDCFRKTAEILPIADGDRVLGDWQEEGRGRGTRGGHGSLCENRARAALRRAQLVRGQHPGHLGEAAAVAPVLEDFPPSLRIGVPGFS